MHLEIYLAIAEAAYMSISRVNKLKNDSTLHASEDMCCSNIVGGSKAMLASPLLNWQHE